MSLDTYNSLMETVHLLRSPANAAHLQRSLEQAGRGATRQLWEYRPMVLPSVSMQTAM
ncbi:MAG: hypothetical protein WBN89_06970 [Prochlorococcaceae cyanobacterium]